MSPRRPSLLAAALLLGGTGLLGACGGEVQDTTCGDYADLSGQQRRDVLVEIADDAGDGRAETFLASSADEQDEVADVLLAACDEADASTTLDDVLDPLDD